MSPDCPKRNIDIEHRKKKKTKLRVPTPRHKKESVQVPSTKEDKERIVESLNTAMVDVTRQEMWPRQAHVLTVSVRRHFREGLFRN